MTRTDTNSLCQNCKGEGWVCEDHTDMCFADCPCDVYGGVPCPTCNTNIKGVMPNIQPDMHVVLDKDGYHPQIIGGKDEC